VGGVAVPVQTFNVITWGPLSSFARRSKGSPVGKQSGRKAGGQSGESDAQAIAQQRRQPLTLFLAEAITEFGFVTSQGPVAGGEALVEERLGDLLALAAAPLEAEASLVVSTFLASARIGKRPARPASRADGEVD
jgi:hypothetical protein